MFGSRDEGRGVAGKNEVGEDNEDLDDFVRTPVRPNRFSADQPAGGRGPRRPVADSIPSLSASLSEGTKSTQSSRCGQAEDNEGIEDNEDEDDPIFARYMSNKEGKIISIIEALILT